MSETAISGVLLFLISAGALAAGLASGEMPYKYTALDTSRETAPVTYWAFVAWWIMLAVFGIAIAVSQ